MQIARLRSWHIGQSQVGAPPLMRRRLLPGWIITYENKKRTNFNCAGDDIRSLAASYRFDRTPFAGSCGRSGRRAVSDAGYTGSDAVTDGQVNPGGHGA